MHVIRTKEHGCWAKTTIPYWGVTFQPCADPEGRDLTLQQLCQIKIPKNFPRLPGSLYSSIVNFYKYFSAKGFQGTELEVAVVLLRGGDRSKLDQWRAVVSHQGVSKVRVEAKKFPAIDLQTGQLLETIPDGWYEAGTSHSHNTMQAFFSPTDDSLELKESGIHIVVGELNKPDFKTLASITYQGKRFIVPTLDLIDATYDPQAEFHPTSLEMVSLIR